MILWTARKAWLRCAHTQGAQSKLTPCDGPVSVVFESKQSKGLQPHVVFQVSMCSNNHLNFRINSKGPNQS